MGHGADLRGGGIARVTLRLGQPDDNTPLPGGDSHPFP